MRILILTQYFPPETGAPQNRLSSLANNLVRSGCTISILTAMPNYPRMEVFPGYRGKIFIKEDHGPLTVFRSFIYVRKNPGAAARIINYFSFAFSSLLAGSLKTGRQDIIFCESPPLFLGITALLLKRIKRAKLVFNVSDLWPESVERLDIIKSKVILAAAYKLESRIYKRSSLVSGQTQGIIKNIKDRFPDVRTFWFRNGIDFTRFDTRADGALFRKEQSIKDNDFVLLYAGVLGHAQGLETVLEAAEKIGYRENIKFYLVGDGPERDKLVHLADAKQLENLFFIPNRPGHEIPAIIAGCDAYLVPLKKNDLFLGAIPSKLFEPLAMGKPLLLGVDGEARKLFIEDGRCGLYCEPGNSEELSRNIEILFNDRSLGKLLGENGRSFVRKYFDRQVIADELYKKLILVTHE
ncbi:MAG: glycosyltransferase family 4 protein [Bacteroidales bacterium]